MNTFKHIFSSIIYIDSLDEKFYMDSDGNIYSEQEIGETAKLLCSSYITFLSLASDIQFYIISITHSRRNKTLSPLPLPATRIAGLAQL